MSKPIAFPIIVKDHFLSQEDFLLERDAKIKSLIKTKNVPSNLSLYYESQDYRSHTKKKKGLIDFLYFKLQRYNLSYKLNILKKEECGKKVLDYGCGSGSWIDYLNKNGYDVTGFEPNEKAFEFAKLNNPKVKVYNNSKEVLKSKYDVITLWHVIEHIENLDEVIVQLKQSLTPDGKLIIALPNYDSWDACFFKSYWAAFDVPRHLYHFNRTAIKSYLNSFGIIIENEYALHLDAFYISMLSLNYKQKSILNFPLAFIFGLYSNLLAKKDKNYSSVIYVASKRLNKHV